jgi:hypothetical protein
VFLLLAEFPSFVEKRGQNGSWRKGGIEILIYESEILLHIIITSYVNDKIK